MSSIQEKFFDTFPLPTGWQVKKTKGGAWSLKTTHYNFVLDLDKKPLFHSQALFKAIGFKGQALKVLDITAGWAREAFLLSQMGCQVRAVESHPFVFHFVRSYLEQKAKGKNQKLNCLYPQKGIEPYELGETHFQIKGLQLILCDSLNYLSQLKTEDEPDVIYMDPMFGEKKKALGKKNMQILKKLVGETKNQHALLKMALQKAKKRVVVKRQRREPSLYQPVLHCFKSHSICYDVFQPKKREALL